MSDSPAPTCLERPRIRLWLADGLEGEDAAAWLAGGEALLEARARVAGDRVLGTGRGSARGLEVGGRPSVWRVNRHGGLLGGLQGARYRSPDRLAREVLLSAWLRSQGVDTPEVLLALAVREGAFWRQHLVTEEVVGARTVFAARDDAHALDAAEAMLERVFDLGLWATDLHPGNLLWQSQPSSGSGAGPRPSEPGRCWLLDLAGASLRERPLNAEERHARRERFARFFQKHAGAVPARFLQTRN
jgi:Lipopolysaccharide kinase (Kdo/WaaP) family